LGAEGAPGRPAGLRYVLVQPPGDQAAEGEQAMNNRMQTPSHKSLKTSFCWFCAFVRRHEGDTPPCTRMGLEKETSLHNNKSNNNIYINELEGCCVAGWGIV